MPKYRRKKNQSKRKGNKKSNSRQSSQSDKNNETDNQQNTKHVEESVKTDAIKTIEAGFVPEQQQNEGKPVEKKEIDFEQRFSPIVEQQFETVMAGCFPQESEISIRKSSDNDTRSDTNESAVVSSVPIQHFSNFSNSCEVSEYSNELLSSPSDMSIRNETGVEISSHKEDEESSSVDKSYYQCNEQLNNDSCNCNETKDRGDDEVATASHTSTSSYSSDSDTLKGDTETPDKEILLNAGMMPLIDDNNRRSADDDDVTHANASNLPICDNRSAARVTTGQSDNSVHRTGEVDSCSDNDDQEIEVKKLTRDPIKFPIVREVIAVSYPYRVESPKLIKPKTDTTNAIKKSRSLDDDEVVILEMSDNSSAGDLTDNQPIVSEADSEIDTEGSEVPKKDNFTILSVQTLPFDTTNKEIPKLEEPEMMDTTNNSQSSDNESFKLRRSKKRAALETHFLPQFLNPRYLDSIKEEGSDLSDAERKSDSGDLRLCTEKSCSDLEDDVFLTDNESVSKKVNAIFPKSNLDFSQKKKHPSNLRSPKTDVIREESPFFIFEAKIIEHSLPAEDNCFIWTTESVAQSDSAEIIYLDSASSSSSDIMDLDNTGAEDADIEDSNDETYVRIETPNIGMEDSERRIFRKSETPTTVDDSISTASISETEFGDDAIRNENRPPVELETNATQNIFNDDSDHKKDEKQISSEKMGMDDNQNKFSNEIHSQDEIPCPIENNIPEVEFCANNAMNATVDHHNQVISSPPTSNENLKLVDVNQWKSDGHSQIENTESDRKTVNNIRIDEINLEGEKELHLIEIRKVAGKCIEEILGECENKLNKQLNEGEENSSNRKVSIHNEQNHSMKNYSDSALATEIINNSDTQNKNKNSIQRVSGESANSEQIQTENSDYPVVQELEYEVLVTDLDAFETESRQIENKILVDQFIMKNGNHFNQKLIENSGGLSKTEILKENCNSSMEISETLKESPQHFDLKFLDNTLETAPIKKLRQLCTEKLTSMPYGNVVLEELASVAKSLSDLTIEQQKVKFFENLNMPYPFPEIPQICDLEVCFPTKEIKPYIKLSPLPPDKLESPPPPPIPEPPKDDAWLGIPTKEDPKVLICLSPSQRNYLEKNQTKNEQSPDHLLDMHKKFVERRGYHELTSQQVDVIHREKSHNYEKNIVSSPRLRNNGTPQSSLSSSPHAQPPLPPPPPLPRSARPVSNESEIAAKLKNDDKNNHRLLAIIRDSEQSSSSENISRRKIDQIVKLPPQVEPSNEHYQCNQNTQTVPLVITSEKSEKTESINHKQSSSSSSKDSSVQKTNIEENMNLNITGEEYFRLPADDIFSSGQKRFSNIETVPSHHNQHQQAASKRYSNIETSSYESRKRIENGNVVYEYSDSNKQKIVDRNGNINEKGQNNFGKSSLNDQIMSDINLDANFRSAEAPKSKSKSNSDSFSQNIKNRESEIKQTTSQNNVSYEEFRQTANESARKAQNEFFDRENFFKGFDDINKYFGDYFNENDMNGIQKTPAESSKVRDIPVTVEGKTDKKTEQKINTEGDKIFKIPIIVEDKKISYEDNRTGLKKGISEEIIHNIPVFIEDDFKRFQPTINSPRNRTQSLSDDYYSQNKKLQQKRLSSQNLDEWMRFTTNLGASSENITKPFQKEVEILYRGRPSNVKAPRLSSSTSNLSTSGKDFSRPSSRTDNYYHYISNQSMIDQTPITCSVSPRFSKRSSLPRDLHDHQIDLIKMKEMELKSEFEKLENERLRIIDEIDQIKKSPATLRKNILHQRSCKLPTLSEEEAFRQQMHDEWLNKVAEREERRLQKIIKISKPSVELNSEIQTENERRKSTSMIDISDEFLRRVKERRSKLCMPSDSDWESGAESQPIPSKSIDNDSPNVKVIEGQAEADLKHLPKHIREFAEFTNELKSEKYHSEKEVFSSSNIKDDSSIAETTLTTMSNVTAKKNSHQSNDDDGLYPYKSSGYMSEPETGNEPYAAVKYFTLDRKCLPSVLAYTDEKRNYNTMPNQDKFNSSSFMFQPGKIENYSPGYSSVSDKASKEWWAEVMDIFNGHTEQLKNSNRYSEGNLSKSLKEQGYESDSNLVFYKRQDVQLAPLSPVEQKQAYRSVQAGGDPPLQGFRKPAPEKPKESDVEPSSLPAKGVSFNENDQNSESSRRYIEGDVNIHFKTPIRYEYKDGIPDDELARCQAENMRKLYEEERRRKYIQELQDMNKRRHTDNFIPSQKSPIPLNRFDDFITDVKSTSQNTVTIQPRTVARALYNFQGQTLKELTFKKGDVIFIRRQVDKNWYEGEHGTMHGLVPANYVEIISQDGVRQVSKKPSEGQARAKFNFSAQSAIELSLNKGELVTLTRRVDENWFEGRIANRKGIFPVSYVEVLTDIGSEDILQPIQSKPVGAPASHSLITNPDTHSFDLLRTNVNDELKKVTNGNQAYPVVRETKSILKTGALHVDTKSEQITYRALYKYRPQNVDELELQEGDIVYVLEKCDDGWFIGTSLRSGCFGTFPGNYVEKI